MRKAKHQPPWGNGCTIEGLLIEQADLEKAEAEDARIEAAERAMAAAKGVPELPERARLDGGFVPTDEQRKMVKDMARCNMPHEAMTLMVRWPNGRPISVVTLRSHFEDELVTGWVEVGMQLFGAVYKKAMAGDANAALQLLARGYGFRETIRQEVTGANGKDLPTGSGVLLVPPMHSAEDWKSYEEQVAGAQRELAERARQFMDGAGEFAKPAGPDTTVQ